MNRKALAFYLANWYAWAVAGVLLALQHPGGSWLADLPWASWGTELGLALAGTEAASAGACWLLMGTLLTVGGVSASVVISLQWLAIQDEGTSVRRGPALKSVPPASATQAFDDSAREAADLVEDPRLRSLIQQLHTRLG